MTGIGPVTVTNQVGEYARLLEWVKDAWLEIQTRHFHWTFLWDRFSLTVVDSQPDYKVPNLRVFVPFTVRLDDETLLEIPYDDYARIYRDPDVHTHKAFVILPDRTMRMLPPANGTLTGDYYRVPQELVNNDDKPLAPAHLHDTIVALAMTYYGTYEDAPEVYQEGTRRFRRWITRMQLECLPDMEPAEPLV